MLTTQQLITGKPSLLAGVFCYISIQYTLCSKIKKILDELLSNYSKKNNQLLLSLSKKYKYKFKFQNIKKYKKFKHYRIFGMGGSSLGAEAIYSFLNRKIRKRFYPTNW